MLTIENNEKYWNGKKIPVDEASKLHFSFSSEFYSCERIQFLKDNKAKLREYINTSLELNEKDQYLLDLMKDDRYLKELQNTYTKMTTPDFYTKWIGYKPISLLADERLIFDSYSSVFGKYKEQTTDFGKLVRELVLAYQNKYREAVSQSQKIIKGFNGEYEVTADLKNALNSQYLKIISSVHFDKYEHDIIIVSEKGVFTIEVKNHSGNLTWKNGEFFETVRGVVKEGEITNPYIQCINHENSLCNIVDPDYVYSVILFANDNLRYSADDPEIAGRLFYMNNFIEQFNSLDQTMSIEEADAIFNTIQEKRIYREDTFNYVDMDKVDDLYSKWFQHINWKINNATPKTSEYKEIREKQLFIEDSVEHLIFLQKNTMTDRDYTRKFEIDKKMLAKIAVITTNILLPFLVYFVATKFKFGILSAIICVAGVVLFFVLAGITVSVFFETFSDIYYEIKKYFEIKKYNEFAKFANQMHKDNQKIATELYHEYQEELPELTEFTTEVWAIKKQKNYYGRY